MRVFTLLFLLPIIFSNVFANGVAIVDSKTGSYLQLISSKVEVTVENQVAVVTTTQEFINHFDEEKRIKFGFPLAEGASAIELLYEIDSQWYKANFSPTPQDTSLPGSGGGEIDYGLKNYMGETPLYFNLDYPVKKDSILTMRLKYVQLLSYEFGNVSFSYANDYSSLQDGFLYNQELNFTLKSERTITLVNLLNLTPDLLFNDGHSANIEYKKAESVADFDYNVEYSLSLDELGLFSMSTFLADSTVPDEYGNGFFTFIVEPDPSDNTTTIDKVFTFIVDRSGSMSGNKIVQARDAATFIVENLNEGDKFNIVDFSGSVTNFRDQHVAYNPENESAALDYIGTIKASGSTNISGSFEKAIPQFSSANDSTANIIIFFTDGNATSGTTTTNGILEIVKNLQTQNETEVSIFTFGIGADVNKQLLTRLAAENNGFAEFLGADELEERITNFYLTIRNPVLLNTELTFEPAIVSETYPRELPNLYKGQQLLINGRYKEAQTIAVTLSGETFGKKVAYQYDMSLTDSIIHKNQFLTKIWAKTKIEHLLVQYYSLTEGSSQALAIKEDVILLSMEYGVLSPFTSFSEGDPVGDPSTGLEELASEKNGNIPKTFEVLGNYPNPFNPTTQIRIKVNAEIHQTISIRIYNALGQLVKTILLNINGTGIYEAHWDGTLSNGLAAPTGNYYFIVDFGNGLSGGKMTLLK
ncbi:MAG: VWA domain-containing protein [Calditrichaeota bacterium]|nr:MAG: VWA domain-containing protein [Calditrichota bacterium]MBL1206072.1 VWA domain-containing protein [Calditrichota bacterium]NOG45898.1 VWA domain-containing protein [Calditrichota bacterium]